MRIGELLIEQRKLGAGDLTRALGDKPADKRLGSFLIAKGLIDFDDMSRALGEQKGVACALAKHLAGRDPALAKLIPAELGRGSCALPIGKSSKGSVIVCVRDPEPALLRALEQAIKHDILMVVAPASRLEHLVAEAYGTASAEEFDIDFDIGADPPPTSRVARGPLPTPPMPFQRVEPPNQFPRPDTPPPLPPLPDMDALDPESIRLSLTDLDDVRVTKDHAQSGQVSKAGTLPPSNKPITMPPLNALAAGTNRPAAPSISPVTELPKPAPVRQLELDGPDSLGPAGSGAPVLRASPPSAYADTLRPSASADTLRPPSASADTLRPPSPPANAQAGKTATRPMSLEAMTVGLQNATTREAATDLALSYVATRWSAGLVLAIRDKTAIGYRGHGVASPESVTVSLGSPSTVQRAVQTKFVSIEAPSGVGQSALTHALNGSRAPAAAPIVVNGQPVAVIAVSDPLEGPQARDMAAADLAKLAEALGSAYKRIMSR